MDERYDLSRSVRDKRYNYIRNYMPHRDYAQNLSYMFQTPTTRVWHQLFVEGKLNEAQSAFWQRKPPEELYDMQADPDEVINLADSPELADVLGRMRQAHREWEYAITDVSMLPEQEMHGRSRDSSPYEMGHDPTRYDFSAVFAAAEYASSSDQDSIPELVRLLNERDAGVRYWAAVGLLSQGQTGAEEAKDDLFATLADFSPSVRIVAAEALGRFGSESDTKDALDVLLRNAAPKNNYFARIAAWNAIDYLDERARPALPALKAIDAQHANVPTRIGEYTVRLKSKTLRDLE
jgi:uncharacterized sulfatase